jgi:transketolase N-terminal domain/subunit
VDDAPPAVVVMVATTVSTGQNGSGLVVGVAMAAAAIPSRARTEYFMLIACAFCLVF